VGLTCGLRDTKRTVHDALSGLMPSRSFARRLQCGPATGLNVTGRRSDHGGVWSVDGTTTIVSVLDGGTRHTGWRSW